MKRLIVFYNGSGLMIDLKTAEKFKLVDGQWIPSESRLMEILAYQASVMLTEIDLIQRQN